METMAGTAERLPCAAGCGGSGHAKVSSSLEHRLLLLLEPKLRHLGGLQGSANHPGTQVRPRAARSHNGRAEHRCRGAEGTGRHRSQPPPAPGSLPRLSHAHACSCSPTPINASLLLQPTRQAGMCSWPPPPDALCGLAPAPALLLQSDTPPTGTDGAMPQMPPCHRCPGSSYCQPDLVVGPCAAQLLLP